MKKFRTIRFRLTAWYTLMVLVLVGGVLLFMFLRLKNHLRRQADNTLEAMAVAAETLVNQENGLETLRAEAQMEGKVQDGKLFFYAIYDAKGRLLVNSPNFKPPEMLEASALPKEPMRVEWHTIGNNQTRLLTAPLTENATETETEKHYVLRVARSGYYDDKMIENLTENLFYFIPAILVLAVAGGSVLARASLRPMTDLSRQAALISEKELNQRLPVRGVGDEIDRHAVALNTMLSRLEGAFDEIQKFAARASHELRTPLASLRLEIERALSRATDAETIANLESAVAEAERLASLVDKLLFLTRLQAEEQQIKLVKVDLAAILLDVAADIEAVSSKEQKHIERKIDGACEILGDETLLKQMLWNVFDNALKYSPPGETVAIGLRKEDGRAVVTVADCGAGMDEETRRRAFEPFFRGPQKAADGRAGFGLGLNIAKWVCENHSGTIEIDSAAGKGTTVTIRLPLSENP